MNQDIGSLGQRCEQIQAFGLRDIQGDAELVGVKVEEQSALVRMPAGRRERDRGCAPHCRAGASSSMTSAPISAISLAAYGADTIVPTSMILQLRETPAIGKPQAHHGCRLIMERLCPMTI